MVSKQLLLEGAIYALENAGALLRDAVALCDRGSFASAVVLTMFGREELSKYRMLREKFEEVAGGATVPVKELTSSKGGLRDHDEKQKKGVLSVVQRGEEGSRLHQLFVALESLTVGSPEWKQARRELEEMTREQAEAYPKQRHALRINALYVDLSDDQSRWIRPIAIERDVAYGEVGHAVGDFNNLLSRFDLKLEEHLPFMAAYRAWVGRPHIAPVDAPVYERRQ